MMNPLNVTERVVIAESPFARMAEQGFHDHTIAK